ncbi:hypothetical protein HNY73_020974 [Argiope bruennichi]|uniref:Uncharacterized protein n=1 Tax=Argiope bruennichi TaxID=94029 RepID=A0A8T0E8P4_ARGBR|nr:hypothetical protein HNY73_020974 [Argiope bruennichi]
MHGKANDFWSRGIYHGGRKEKSIRATTHEYQTSSSSEQKQWQEETKFGFYSLPGVQDDDVEKLLSRNAGKGLFVPDSLQMGRDSRLIWEKNKGFSQG